MDFADEDFTKIWSARSMTNNGEGGGPTTICMTDRNRFGHWAGLQSDKNWHYTILQALELLQNSNTDYKFNEKEWCTGWADIYYIPRVLWPDYIYLASFFGSFDAFHEMAIPTMFHILDQSRRHRPYSSIINWIGDCYGGCCNRGGDVDNLLEHRCGHALNYLGDKKIIETHYGRLDEMAATLGKPGMTPAWKKIPAAQRDWTAFLEGLPQQAVDAYKKASSVTPTNAYQDSNMPVPIPYNATGIEDREADWANDTYWGGVPNRLHAEDPKLHHEDPELDDMDFI